MVNGKCKLHWQLAKGMEWFGLECAHLSHYPGLKRKGGGGLPTPPAALQHSISIFDFIGKKHNAYSRQQRKQESS